MLDTIKNSNKDETNADIPLLCKVENNANI